MKDNNKNNRMRKQIKETQKEERKILKMLKLSRISYKSQHIINSYLMNKILAVMEKISGWQKKDEENLEKIKRELIKESEWKKIKDYLENLWLNND